MPVLLTKAIASTDLHHNAPSEPQKSSVRFQPWKGYVTHLKSRAEYTRPKLAVVVIV